MVVSFIPFLNSFFGEDPPLLAIFLKKLGYEVDKTVTFVLVCRVK